MPKVLILTAGYGEGHNAAARGLHAALIELGADAEVLDLFALTGGAFYNYSRRGYLELINRAPNLWAAVYRLIDAVPIASWTLPLLGKMRRALAQIIKDRKPDSVISVYPVYGYLIERIFPDSAKRPFAFHTIVTDSITINSVWHACASDTFLVANEASATVMLRSGVQKERLRVLGFPVPPRFARDRPARANPGADQPARILFMINAGRDKAPAIVARLLKIDRIHLTVTVGRDEKLRARIEEAARAASKPVEIHGWTPMMPELLMTHHLVIGKAGGAAVQEAIAARTPMLITHIVPGQEEGNARLLFENGCGALCKTPDALAEKIEHLFASDAAEWGAWEEAIGRLSKPDAAIRIAEMILKEASHG